MRSARDHLSLCDNYDRFGMSRRALTAAHRVARPLYTRYFRVDSVGSEHVPKGPSIVVSNHSGMLPFDGAMLAHDLYTRRGVIVRPVADHLVARLPLVSTTLQRLGVVGGSLGNARALLQEGASLLIFPEGMPGIGKPFSQRYQLTAWRPGHAELALRFGVPIVPVAVIGAEEQYPAVHNSRALGRLIGAPYVPLPAHLLPLPTKYHLHYGAPIAPEGNADSSRDVRAHAARSRDAVAGLIAQGLAARRGIFW